MNLYKNIDQEIKKAILNKDRIALDTLRSIKTAFMEATTAKGAEHFLNDEQSIVIIQRMLKQRRESARIFEDQGRTELAQRELAEAEVLQSFLPKQYTEEELEKAIGEIIVQTDASSLKDMGKVMRIATKDLGGKAEGKAIADIVRKLLS